MTDPKVSTPSKADIQQIKADLDILISQRSLAFARLNNVWDVVQVYTVEEIDDFKCRYDNLAQLEIKFSEIQAEINKCNQVLPSKQQIDIIQTQLSYDNLAFQIKSAYIKLKKQVPDSVTVSNPSSTSTCNHQQKPLAIIKLPVFSGEPDQWLEFISLFQSLVHTDASLDPIRKFQYLKSNLAGEARSHIAAFAMTPENYQLAYDALVTRYQNKRRLAAVYIDKILEFKAAASQTLTGLKAFLDDHQTSISAIRALGIADLADFLMFAISSRNLDPTTKRRFESRFANTQVPTYNQLMDFVVQQVQTLELTLKKVNKSHQFKPKSFVVTSQAPKNSNSSQVNSKFSTCPICREPHMLGRCPVFLKRSLADRYAYLRSNHKCFNCLGSHSRTNCRSKSLCFHCRSNKHHSSLHPTSDSTVEPSSSGSAPPTTENPVSNVVTNVATSTLAPVTSLSNATPMGALNCVNHNSISNVSNVANKASFHHTSDVVSNVAPSGHIIQVPPLTSNISNFKSQMNHATAFSSLSGHNQTVSHVTGPTGISNFVSVPKQVLLGTAQVLIADQLGNFQQIRALIDPGSQVSAITSACARLLSLKPTHSSITVSGVGVTQTKSLGVINCILKSKYSNSTIFTSAVVLPSITTKLPSAPISQSIYNQFSQLDLADVSFHAPSNIDFLIGADVYPQLLISNHSDSIIGNPSAINTVLGWLIVGPVNNSEPHSSVSLSTSVSLQDQLQQFWAVEDVHRTIPPDPLDELAEQIFKDNHYRDENGRFTVALPFRPGVLPPLSNRQRSFQSFLNLEKRLLKQPIMHEAYKAFMNEYVDLNHMSPVSNSASYVIPHHCVTKESSSTTKIRVVFNASDLGGPQVSLNSLLLSGPKLQSELSDILISFRFNKIALCADIKMMYRQILIRPEDRKFQHIFFRPSAQSPVIEYELNTVTYGLTPSAYLAQRCLRQLATDQHAYPLASEAIFHSTYVDDVITGADIPSQAVILRNQLQDLMASGGFPLRKWASNDPSVLADLSDDLLESPLEFSHEDFTIKILGLIWDPKSDCFKFHVKPFISTVTKRNILSYIAKIFDPLGFLSPILLTLKHLLQQLWLSHTDWDSPVSDSIANQWTLLTENLSGLASLCIPRYVLSSDIISIRIVGFCDASIKGYASAIYLCVSAQCGYFSTLIKAKTKVAPLKSLTIPRLELCGALLLSQLLDSISTPLKRFSTVPVYLFSDSEIVLSWLSTPPHLLKTYVANRVVAISELTQTCVWAHVSSDLNPADLASRGSFPHHFIHQEVQDLWFNGPSFLRTDYDCWPSFFHRNVSDVTPLPELKSPEVNILPVQSSSDPFVHVLQRFSSFHRLRRTFAWVRRFIFNCKARHRATAVKSGPLTSDELALSQSSLVYVTQRYYFVQAVEQLLKDQPVISSLATLSPFLDSTQLIRVGGRLSNAKLPFNVRHPILLPKQCHLSKLLCQHFHLVTLHSGPHTTQAVLQAHYWIVSLRSLLRSVIHKCSTCHKFRARPFQPKMADLPSSRVNVSRPFTHVGTDFAGPFSVRSGNPRKPHITKGYLCIFVCLCTKCVTLEFVSDLSTASFLAALDRLVARRGLPHKIYSDQGRNFLGAARHLKEVSAFLMANQPEIGDHLASKEVLWQFNPAYAPNFGGLWEAVVKSAKSLMFRLIGTNFQTTEEYFTLFARIEAVLNSRPLCSLASDPSEASDYLSPGHFLTGAPLLAVPEISIPSSTTLRDRWERQRQLTQLFWTRWSREYLNTLTQRHKWTNSTVLPKVGDVVFLKGLQPSAPLSWPIGRITSLLPTSDGVPRVATIKMANSKLLTRAINSLVPLPESD